jgi:hypothetical protein
LDLLLPEIGGGKGNQGVIIQWNRKKNRKVMSHLYNGIHSRLERNEFVESPKLLDL